MTERVFAAVDLGASSGRVVAGVVAPGTVRVHEVHRFPNQMRATHGHLRWAFTALSEQVLIGLTLLARQFPTVESIGIDTWGVDYGLLDRNGCLLAEPIAYRDPRTATSVHDVHAVITPAELFAITGLQHLSFNTIYQLASERGSEHWNDAAHVVLLPDLLAYWLTGELRTEATIASTTGLCDIRSGTWAPSLFGRLHLSPAVMPRIEPPGTVRGPLRADVRERTGLPSRTVVTTVASHDTASAVAAVPATNRDFAYISSGTWSLAGLELDEPVLTAEARLANFTNERGVDDRIRFLRNISGLWLLQESLRTWADAGLPHDLATLLAAAEQLAPGGPTVDVDDPVFSAPGDMPARVTAACGRAHLSPVEVVRCILDSLSGAYATTLHRAASVSGRHIDVVHVVGGGAQNALLCRLTAAAADLPVVAGPVEATAIGNVMIQARTHGAAPASLDDIRALIERSTPLQRYEPA